MNGLGDASVCLGRHVAGTVSRPGAVILGVGRTRSTGGSPPTTAGTIPPNRDRVAPAAAIGGVPVVETRLRVPQGDVVQRVFAVADAGGHHGRSSSRTTRRCRSRSPSAAATSSPPVRRATSRRRASTCRRAPPCTRWATGRRSAWRIAHDGPGDRTAARRPADRAAGRARAGRASWSGPRAWCSPIRRWSMRCLAARAASRWTGSTTRRRPGRRSCSASTSWPASAPIPTRGWPRSPRPTEAVARRAAPRRARLGRRPGARWPPRSSSRSTTIGAPPSTRLAPPPWARPASLDPLVGRSGRGSARSPGSRTVSPGQLPTASAGCCPTASRTRWRGVDFECHRLPGSRPTPSLVRRYAGTAERPAVLWDVAGPPG